MNQIMSARGGSASGGKKIFLCLVVFTLLLSGCFHKKEEVYMDKPAEDGKYYYENKDLGFSVTLPPEFIYYQTQRKEFNNYKDIEFFVPTTIEFRHEVPGYAKPMVVRIFNKDSWDEMDEKTKSSVYNKIEEKNNKVYAVRFWDLPPDDWKEKWTEKIKNEILDSFNIK